VATQFSNVKFSFLTKALGWALTTVLQVEDVKQVVFLVLLHQSDSAQIHGLIWQFRLYDNASAVDPLSKDLQRPR
jgi:hypothetical protein